MGVRKCDPAWQQRNNSDNISGVLNCQRDEKCYCHQKKVKPRIVVPKVQTLYEKDAGFCDLESQLALDALVRQNESKSRSAKATTATKSRKNKPQSCPCFYHKEAEELYRKYFNLSKETYNFTPKKSVTVLEKPETDNTETLDKAESLDKLETDLDLSEMDSTMADLLYKQQSSQFLSQSATDVALAESTLTPAPSTDDTLNNIKQFRQQNYSETHDKTEPEPVLHKCVYRFSLDKRLCPQPENPNEYGLNSCLICHKPMPTHKRQICDEKTRKQRQGPLDMLSKIYPYTLTPKQVNMGVDVNLEMCLTERDVQLFNDCFKEKTKRPVYKNSLALRQQKMLGSALPID